MSNQHFAKISRVIKNPSRILLRIIYILGPLFKDSTYLKLLFKIETGHKLNIDKPILYQEKLQWLKLHDHKDYYTLMVDKITAKKYVANIIGEQYIIPTLGVWEKFDDIDFDALPNSFVLKTNNGGGNTGVIICKDKTTLDKNHTKRVIEESLRYSIYKRYREWPYKNVKPKIFAEELMSDNSEFNKCGLTDYKFTCFNGHADNVMVCVDRNTNETKFYFYDREWNLLPLNIRGKNTDPSFKLPKPDCMEEMFDIAAKLSEGIPFLRVDLYCINGRPYFGETTFYPASGFDKNLLHETEVEFGNRITLPINN